MTFLYFSDGLDPQMSILEEICIYGTNGGGIVILLVLLKGAVYPYV
jgi:hypothetical protein